MPQQTFGPIPKRSTERRRRNKESKAETISVLGRVVIPRFPKSTHPIARRWFNALKRSGQARFFEPSDWAAALLITEQLTRLLTPMPPQLKKLLRVTEEALIFLDATKQINMAAALRGALEQVQTMGQPIGGKEFGAIWQAMNDLLTTEAARRRARLEVEHSPEAGEIMPGMTKIADFRKRREQAQ